MKTLASVKRTRAPVRLGASVLAVFVAFPVLAQAQSLAELNDVVVTATRFNENPFSYPQGVSLLKQSDIQKSGAQSVPEALMKLLGIAGKVDLSGGGNYALDLRGFGETADSNQVIIVDGRRLNEGDLVKANLAAIPIDTVQSIEILRGSSAVLYGEGATGGAIVISTKAGLGLQKPSGANVSYGMGSYGTRDERASANIGAGPWSLDVAAQERYTDGYRKNFASQQNSVNAAVQWSNEWMRAGVQVGNSKNRSGLPGPLTLAEFTMDASQVGIGGSLTDWGQTKSDNMAFFWQGTTELWDLGADLTRRNRAYESENYGANAYAVEGNAYNFRAKRKFSASKVTGSVAFGLEMYDWVRQSSLGYGFPDTSRSKTENQAYFGLAQLNSIALGTGLEVGYRIEKVKKTKSTYNGSLEDTLSAWHLGVNQPFAEHWRAFARIGTSYRLGNIDEVFPFGVTSVADLLPQESRDAELGASWRRDKSSLELRWYRNSVQNEIAYDGSQNVNLDRTEHRGLELEGRTQLTQSITLRANVAARENVFTGGTSAGKVIYLTPKHTAAFYAEYDFSPSHTVALGLVRASSQYVNKANSCTVPAYTTADTRYSYRRDRLEFSFAINNLTDTKYYTYAFGCTSGIYPEAGRSVQANLKYKF